MNHKYEELAQTYYDTDGHEVSFDNEEATESVIMLDQALSIGKEADKEIAALESKLAEMEWVSVSDRLPVKMDRYDVWLSGNVSDRPRRLTEIIWSEPHGGWTGEHGKPLTYLDQKITHWQALPSPPQESTDD